MYVMRLSKVLAIHYYILGDTSLPEGIEDIVAMHCRHNCAPHLPSNSQLAVVRHQQCSTSAPHTVPATALQEASGQPEVMQPPQTSQQGQVRKPTPHVGSATEGADLSQLYFYKPAVHNIIEQAKQFSHCDVASINAFPLRLQFNKHALEYIEEVILEKRTQSLFVPDGN